MLCMNTYMHVYIYICIYNMYEYMYTCTYVFMLMYIYMIYMISLIAVPESVLPNVIIDKRIEGSKFLRGSNIGE
jgi:hypothetical protein